MTCKDNCLFAPLCKYNDGISEWSLSNCPLHKDRSRFIELPCAVGSTVYFICFDEICEATVVRIEFNYYSAPKEWIVIEYYSKVIGVHEHKSRIDLPYRFNVRQNRIPHQSRSRKSIKRKALIMEKVYLTYDEAVSLLPDGEDIHTFKNASFGLIGADWSREEILNKLRETDIVIELTGEQAKAMKHGMCAYSKDTKYHDEVLFIETDEEKLSAFEQERSTDKCCGEQMTFPETFEEFAEQYKIVDKEQVYTNGTELIPIFRVKQWLEHKALAERKQI